MGTRLSKAFLRHAFSNTLEVNDAGDEFAAGMPMKGVRRLHVHSLRKTSDGGAVLDYRRTTITFPELMASSRTGCRDMMRGGVVILVLSVVGMTMTPLAAQTEWRYRKTSFVSVGSLSKTNVLLMALTVERLFGSFRFKIL